MSANKTLKICEMQFRKTQTRAINVMVMPHYYSKFSFYSSENAKWATFWSYQEIVFSRLGKLPPTKQLRKLDSSS